MFARRLGSFVLGSALAGGGLCFGWAVSAKAASLTEASMSLELGTLPGATFAAVNPSGTALSNLSATLAAGTAFNGTTTRTPDPVQTVSKIIFKITTNDMGVFTAINPSTLRGVGAIRGIAIVKGLGATLLPVPVAAGTPATIFASGNGVFITAVGASWTAGTASVTGVPYDRVVYVPSIMTSIMVTGLTTSTRMGNNGLSPSGIGNLVLVAPIKVTTSLTASPVVAAFATLSLTYTPEPATLLLQGGAIAALILLGRSRARK